MKKIFFIVAICALLAVCACNKEAGSTKTDVPEAVYTTGTLDVPDNTSSTVTTELKFKIPEDIEMTDTQKEAAESAQGHLNGAGVSKAKLIQALVEEGHSQEDAEFVVEIFGIDWNEMARGTAEFYTYYMPFSYQGMIDHLEYMGFTHEQAVYGTDQLEVDWDENVSEYIEKYYMYESFAYDELVTALEEAGFTHDQAVNGIKDYEEEKESQRAEESSLREELGLEKN